MPSKKSDGAEETKSKFTHNVRLVSNGCLHSQHEAETFAVTAAIDANDKAIALGLEARYEVVAAK